jgi:ferredoxin--NADP+ reductase
VPTSERAVARRHGIATLVERRLITPTLGRFRFALDSGIPEFLPGQFITLGVAPPAGTTRVPWRAYSIASAPHEKDAIELFVREALEPVPGRFTTALFALQRGDALPHRGITGAFTIEPGPRAMLCVAAGTGIAPFVSYARSLHHEGAARTMVLVHGARTPLDLGGFDELRAIEASPGPFRLRYIPTISRPSDPASASWTGETGRVETLIASRLEAILGEPLTPDRWFAHACGFEGTVSATFAELQAKGFLTRREKREDGSFDLKTESFG